MNELFQHWRRNRVKVGVGRVRKVDCVGNFHPSGRGGNGKSDKSEGRTMVLVSPTFHADIGLLKGT